MHPEITKTISALRVGERHGTAAAARLARQARPGSGLAGAAGGRNAGRRRLAGRRVPGWLRLA